MNRNAIRVALPLAVLAVALGHPGIRASLEVGVGRLVAGDHTGLRDWAAEFGWAAPLATSLLMIVQGILAPIPAVVITVTNSLLFGPFWGGILSIVSATGAAVVCFGLARLYGEPILERTVGRSSIETSQRFMEEHGTNAILIARLMPFVPFDPTSFAAGLTRMRVGAFTGATLIGQIPAGMAYAYLGQELARPQRLVILAIPTLIGLALLGRLAGRLLGESRTEASGRRPSRGGTA